jgi:hypothetical protein
MAPKTQDARSVAGRGEKTAVPWKRLASARASELATLVLDWRAERWPAMNDLSAFDGDAERERQICDLRIRGKTEAEVCQMLGCTVLDIHRALDRSAQAAMTPAARVRSIYIDAARLEGIQQVFLPLVESADDKAALTIIRARALGDLDGRQRPVAR